MRLCKIACTVLSAALFAGSIPGIVYADEPEVITRTYTFTSEEGSNIQLTDEFVFREDCFMQSSFIGCAHLAALSAQAAMASSTRYGNDVDPYARDTSNGAANILSMLTSMGFTDAEANGWYNTETQVDSCAVAIGTRTLTVDGHEYTLLAVIPRSVNYRQEWTGNIDLGTGNIHEGFLEARDECLRFMRQYIQNHNITGDLKVWIAGHSRGGAISNLLGGFLAGGGIEYFGGQVSITPEDVYCYTLATPRPVRTGVTTSAALSVSGARGGTYYADTPGDAYVYPEDTVIDLAGTEYSGIRNYPLDWDLIPYLPLAEWGYTYYGNTYNFNDISEEQMLAELQTVSPYVYNYYATGRSAYDFHEKTFDLASMSLVDIGEGGTDAAIAYLRSRVSGLLTLAPDSSTFVNSGMQTVLAGLAGIYGMMSPMFKTQEGLAGKLAKPLVYCYLAYASEQLINEGRAADEQEGIAIAITELLEFFLGKDIDHTTYTVDAFIVDLASFVRDHKDSELVQNIVSTITTLVPETYKPIIRGYLGSFYPGYDDTTPLGDVVVAYLCACVDGADPASAAYSDDNNKTGEGVRKHSLYTIASLMPMLIPALQPVIDAIGYDSSHTLDGSGTFSGFAYAIIQYLGGPNYTDIQTAADQKLGDALTTVFNDMLTAMDGIYPQSYIDACRTHTDAVVANAHDLRTVIMTLLLYNGGSFNTEANIRNLCTVAGNMGMIASTHYDETYIAYAKAAARSAGPHYNPVDENVIIYNMTEGIDVGWTGSGTLTFAAERNIDPETTYDHFTGISVDEVPVDPSMYSIERGSIIVTLSEAYLMTLSEGRHLLRIEFNDPGCAEAYFYIANITGAVPANPAATGTTDGTDPTAPAGDSTVASTGEEMDVAVTIKALMLFAGSAVCLLLSIKKRREAFRKVNTIRAPKT